MKRASSSPKSLGRELIGGGESLAVERFRSRLFSSLPRPPRAGARALELGCGDGLASVHLARLGWKVEATDLEPHPGWKSIAAASKGRIRFRPADVGKLGRLKGGYDLVFEKDMLHHVPDPVAVLKQMRRLAGAGGQVIVVEANRHNPIFYLHLTLMEGHQHFSRAQLLDYMAQSGMKDVELQIREARVWPFQSVFFQDWMEKIQDLFQALFFLRPFLCYHLAFWKALKTRPA